MFQIIIKLISLVYNIPYIKEIIWQKKEVNGETIQEVLRSVKGKISHCVEHDASKGDLKVHSETVRFTLNRVKGKYEIAGQNKHKCQR